MTDGAPKPETPAPASASNLDLSKMTKGSKISFSIGGLAALAAGAYFGHAWIADHLDIHMLTTAEAQELTQQVKQATDAANAAAAVAAEASNRLTGYIETQDLRQHREQLAQLEDQLADTLLWESENGENQVSRARKVDLRERIEARRLYIECVVRDRPGETCTL